MEEEQIIKMIEKYLAGKASTEEVSLLNTWFDSFDTQPSFTSCLSLSEQAEVSDKMFRFISQAFKKKEYTN